METSFDLLHIRLKWILEDESVHNQWINRETTNNWNNLINWLWDLNLKCQIQVSPNLNLSFGLDLVLD